jgi:hypothetical protein
VREHPNISQISDLGLFCVQLGCVQLGFPACVFHQSVRRRPDEKTRVDRRVKIIFSRTTRKSKTAGNHGQRLFLVFFTFFRIYCKYTPWTSNVETVEYHLKCASFNRIFLTWLPCFFLSPIGASPSRIKPRVLLLFHISMHRSVSMQQKDVGHFDRLRCSSAQ